MHTPDKKRQKAAASNTTICAQPIINNENYNYMNNPKNKSGVYLSETAHHEIPDPKLAHDKQQKDK